MRPDPCDYQIICCSNTLQLIACVLDIIAIFVEQARALRLYSHFRTCLDTCLPCLLVAYWASTSSRLVIWPSSSDASQTSSRAPLVAAWGRRRLYLLTYCEQMHTPYDTIKLCLLGTHSLYGHVHRKIKLQYSW